MGSNDQGNEHEASVSQPETTPTVGRMGRRAFLRTAALGSAALGLLACAPAAPASPTAPAAKPAEAPKPAAPAAPAATGAAPAAAKPGETPRQGGELVFVVSAEPDTFDGHKSTTFANIHPVAPHHNTLVKFDPDGYPKIIGDLAESWTLAPDGLSYTFKVRDGVKFHDGSPFSSKDVKASYDRLGRGSGPADRRLQAQISVSWRVANAGHALQLHLQRRGAGKGSELPRQEHSRDRAIQVRGVRPRLALGRQAQRGLLG